MTDEATFSSRLWRSTPYLMALVAAAGLYGLTFQITQGALPGTLGPRFWPRMAIGLMAVAALFEVARIFAVSTTGHQAADEIDHDEAPRHPWLVVGGVLLVCAYAAAVTTLGYILSSLAFLIALMYLGRYRNHVVIWTTSLVGMAAIALVFLKVVYVSLPRGTAPFDAVTQFLLGLIGIR